MLVALSSSVESTVESQMRVRGDRFVVVTDIAHAIRRWLPKHSNDEGWCLLTMDLENAYNQINRSCFLREVQRECHTRYCRAISEGRALAEAINSPVNMAALP